MPAVEKLLLETTISKPLDKPAINLELRRVIAQKLAPKVKDIDSKGEYPKDFMHRVGALGGFGQAVPPEFGGTGYGLKAAVQVIEEISKECVSTGFITWCQIACAWYLQNSENNFLRQQVLPQVATGRVLAGTGLSNPMKNFAGIEKILLTAERQADGYVVNGMLPWVSNIGPGNYFAIAVKIANSEEYMMAIVSDEFQGLSLRCNAHFIALEGSQTFSCIFRKVFIPDEFVLAAPCNDYVARIRPGFILTQVGLGLGLVASCVEIMKRYNKKLSHVNCFLDDQAEDVEADLEMARLRTYALADAINLEHPCLEPDLLKEVIQARITASELSLRAANAAMLHAGARAYIQGSDPERKLRESYFIAIVTPAIKHLKKMLSQMKDVSVANDLLTEKGLGDISLTPVDEASKIVSAVGLGSEFAEPLTD